MPDVGTLTVNLVAGTSSFDGPLNKSGETARSVAGGIQDDFNKIDMSEARGGVMLLGEEIGIHLPRHVQSFLATLPGVAAAMEAAFPILAIVAIGMAIEEFAEKLGKAREKTEGLADAQTKLGMEGQRALNSLGDKFLELGIKADELKGDHIAALGKQLQLIDDQSLATLGSAFDKLAEHTDAYFKQLQAHWYQMGIGSAGASHALNTFQVQYDDLLAKKDKDGAGDLLAGTLNSAKATLNAMTLMNSEGGQLYQHQSQFFGQATSTKEVMEANLLLAKNKVGLSEDEVHSQEALVNLLTTMGQIQKENDKDDGAAKSGAVSQEKLKAFADEKAKSEQALALRLAQLETEKAAAIQSYTAQGMALDAAKRKADSVYDPQIVTAQVDSITALVKQGAQDGVKASELTALAGKAAVTQEHAKRVAIDETTAAQQRALAKSITAGEADAKIYEDTVKQASKELQEKLAHVDAMEKIDDEHLKAELASGQISEKQYEALLQAELLKTKENDQAILAEELKLYDTGSADYQRVKKQMQAIDDKYLADKKKAEDAANQKESSGFQKQLQDWQNVQKQMQQLGMQTLNSLNSGMASFLTTGKADWASMAQSAIEGILQIGLHYAESYVGMAVMHALFGDQVAAQDILRYTSAISTNAMIAQSSAWEAAATTLADVPYPENIAASAEVLDLGLGYAAGASAAQGAVLPNKEMLVNTHPEEMILPKHISNFIVNSAAAANGKGQSAQAAPSKRGGDVHIHLHDVTDGAGVQGMVQKQIIPMLKKHIRQGRF
jgi:lambda family phage tail tape measure protein